MYNHNEKKTNSLDSNSVLFDQTPRPGISVQIQQDLGMEQEDFEALHKPSRETHTNSGENHSHHIPYKTERQHISSEPEVNSEHFVESRHHTAVQETGEDFLKAVSDCGFCKAERQGISVGVKQEAGLDQEQWDTVQPTSHKKAKGNKDASSPSFKTDRPRSGVQIKQEPVSVEDLWDTPDPGPEVDSGRTGHSCSHPNLINPPTSPCTSCSVKGHTAEADTECAVSIQQKTTDSINSHMTSGIAFKKLKSETWLENQPKQYGNIKINTSSTSVIGFQGKATEFLDESDSETLPVHFQVPEVSSGSKSLYECAMCQLTFSLPAQLHEHVADHDADNRHYSCAECHTSFQHLALLKQHVITHTFGEGSELQYENRKSFVCHVCSKVFRRLCELNRHQKIHSGSKPFVCEVCHKAFARGDELNRHQRVHAGVKPYQCDECTRAYITNHELSQHKKSHSESKPFECPLCSRGFLRADKLFHHEQMHAGLRSFECEVCPKAFITQSELNQHKKIHSGMKPYVCEVCCKAYLKVSDLNRHRKVHTGQKPYVCDVCSKAFHTADMLSGHKKIHTRQKHGKQDI